LSCASGPTQGPERRLLLRLSHAAPEDGGYCSHRDVRPPHPPFSEALPLVHFFEAFLDPQDKEPSRDFAVGLIELAEPMPAVPARTRYARIALPLLSAALEDSPDDLHALHAKGFALWLLDFPTEAMTCFESVLQAAPKREATLFCAARLAASVRDEEMARSYWQRTVAANPYSPSYHIQLGRMYAESKDWAKTIRECDQALRINPMSIEAHKLLIWYYLQTDRKSDARGALEKLVLLDPPNAKELRQRFGELMK